jgi:PPM family protein phosphatase
MKFTARTHIGQRYDHNEDAFILPEIGNQMQLEQVDLDCYGHLFLLADGIGGANAGEVASQLAVRWVFQEYYQSQIQGNQLSTLKNVIQEINKKLYDLAQVHIQYQGMGSTLVAVIFEKEKLFACTIGDSRLYRMHSQKLEQLSEDQSEVWELYKLGEISKDAILTHPRNHILKQALALEPKVKILIIDGIAIEPNDIFLLNSDGLTDMVEENEIEEILKQKIPLEKKAENLISVANINGGKDNITVVLVEF